MTLNAVYLVLGLVAVCTLVGVLWRRRQGRAVRVAPGRGPVIRPADLDARADQALTFGTAATLLQFSTEFCSSCPATRRMLKAVAAGRPGVAHVDVDLTHRADLASTYGILQTPTTFILDGSGAVMARIGGSVRPDVVSHHLDQLAGAPA